MSDPFANRKPSLIVFKVGSALLVGPDGGSLRRDWLARLCDDIAEFGRHGHRMIVVSSGAIALGRRVLGYAHSALKLEESQAAAAVGQVRLAQAWAEGFARSGLVAAQILLTLDDTEARRRYLNARATLQTLLDCKAVPVINENDTVATAEIRYGDNDRLAARVASMMGADLLVLLSDIDGLYTANPQRDANAAHIPVVERITPEIEAMATGPVSGFSRGGMASKIAAAKIATAAGCDVLIAKGADDAIAALRAGARHTRFVATTTPAAARKRWIAGGLKLEGRLVVDDGAVRALQAGKSLLPAGVTQVEGDFARGDAVRICDAGGAEIARGVIAYSAKDARAIAGRRSGEIEAILGYAGRDAMVHRDDLAMAGAVS